MSDERSVQQAFTPEQPLPTAPPPSSGEGSDFGPLSRHWGRGGASCAGKGAPWRLAVLLSGSGRTLENLLAVIGRGELDARVVAVISSKPGVRGLAVAEAAGIPRETLVRRDFPDNAAYSDAIFAALAPHHPQAILLCGFLRQLVVPAAWEGRILNIHPALLPRAASYAAGRGLYGERVHRAVLEHGDAVSGATVHLVTNDYDEGPPVLQREVPVQPGDTPATLGARVFAAECALYPEAIRGYLAAHPELRTPPVYEDSRR